MRGQTIILRGPSQRLLAKGMVDNAPLDAVVNVKMMTRTNEQNAKMWAMISDVMRAQPEGRRWIGETWKCAFMHHLGWQVQFCPSLEGNDPFPVGYGTSRLNKSQMSDLIECIYEYSSRHDVRWSEPHPDLEAV